MNIGDTIETVYGTGKIELIYGQKLHVSFAWNENLVVKAIVDRKNVKTTALPGWEKVPFQLDGWVLKHNAFRLDMNDATETINAIKSHIEGDNFSSWMIEDLFSWYENFCHQVQKYTNEKEKVNALKSKTILPKEFTADDGKLSNLLKKSKQVLQDFENRVKTQKDVVKNTLLEDVNEFSTVFQDLKSALDERFNNEQSVFLPLYRENISVQEHQLIEKQQAKNIDPMSYGHMLRPLSDTEKKKIAKDGKTALPVLKPKVWKFVKSGGKYDTKYSALTTGVIDGKRIEISSSTCIVA